MRFIASLALLLFSVTMCLGQQSDSLSYLSLKTKSKKLYQGKLIAITEDSIVINDEEKGRLAFARSSIDFFQTGLFKNRFDGTPNSSVPFLN